MPTLNRRQLMQAAGATGLAAIIPAVPASATAKGAAKPSQMLWASLYNKAGNSNEFVGVANSMGVSGKASQGIHNKLVQNQVLAA